MKSNLSSFWLCYRGRDPIFSLEKPHTRSLENKEILKFHSDTFDRKTETVIFAQLKDFSKPQNKLTTSWNDSIAILLNHQPVCSQSIKKSASCRSGENKVVKSLPKDRSFSIALSFTDRGLKLSEAEQKGTEGRGSRGTILRSSPRSNVGESHAKKTCPLVALKNEGRNKARQLKTKERNISENIPFDSYWVTWWVLFFFWFSFLFFSCSCLLAGAAGGGGGGGDDF